MGGQLSREPDAGKSRLAEDQNASAKHDNMPVPRLSHGALQRALIDPQRLTPADVLALQRTIGNAALQRMLAGRARPQPRPAPQSPVDSSDPLTKKASPSVSKTQESIQRVIVDDKDPSNVLLDGFNRRVEMVQTITAYIYTSRYGQNEHAMMPSFDDLYEVVDGLYPLIEKAIFAEDSISIAEVAMDITMEAHSIWLTNAERTVDPTERLPTHDTLGSDKYQDVPLQHYDFFDKDMLWRWTSKPSTEQVYTAKRKDDSDGGDEITYQEIVKVVAAHSGGNDKSNPNVKTLSFGRNPASLMGVAASAGGDKHVLNIIDKAEYLYGIDINSLAEKGITAHAATARMISLFESEYVLISTPGFPSTSLDELATVKYKNPFKGQAIRIMGIKKGAMAGIEKEMGTVVPEKVKDAKILDINMAKQILEYARKTKKAADPLSFAVQDKEPLNWKVAGLTMTKYTSGLK